MADIVIEILRQFAETLMFSDLVTELLGSDLMEHNILHSGIGIDEALEILNRDINFLTNIEGSNS